MGSQGSRYSESHWDGITSEPQIASFIKQSPMEFVQILALWSLALRGFLTRFSDRTSSFFCQTVK